MQIMVKDLLLEGYLPEQILEVYVNSVNRPDAKNYMANNNTFADSMGTLAGSAMIGGPSVAAIPAVAAGLYGNTGDRQYKIQKQSLIDTKQPIGAWDKAMLAKGQYLNNYDNQLSNTADLRPGHYFLNPFVGGPITHTWVKGSRGVVNGAYKLLKNKNSPDMSTSVSVAANPNAGAFNSGLDVGRNSSNNYADDVAQIRRENLGQYLLNPFVAGPVNELAAHVGGAVNQGVRLITSPTTKSGSTLVHNIGRRV